ncbi:site-specific integrase [Pseudomonas aeruginosa]|uniref:site-specific integrase n=1 Tax=Pseudomonas aeruginosa TaxID=287 RepID=UPI001F4BA906|nr:site-specific integrase [Pseudomonas aeruginosa]
MPLPIVLNSNGSLNWEINSFITKIGGGPNSYGARSSAGTVFDYARSIDRFNSFLESKGMTLFDTNDDTLDQFVKHLSKSGSTNNDTIKSTLRKILLLLEHTQVLHPHLNLFTLGSPYSDHQVHATERFNKNKQSTNGRYLSHEHIDHLPKTYRKPVSYITNSEIDAWHSAIYDYTDNKYIIERWYCFSVLLEHLGGRLSEILSTPASAILDAYKNDTPINKIPVLKGRFKGSHRTVKIPTNELQEVAKFIKKTHELFPESKVNDSIFVHEIKGTTLSRNTFNSYYRTIISKSQHARTLSGISHHNFRHRYFTILVARNIRKLSDRSPQNSLRIAMGAALADSLHASIETLSSYVHLSNDQEIQDLLDHENLPSKLTQVTISLIKEAMAEFHSGKINNSSLINKIDNLLDD